MDTTSMSRAYTIDETCSMACSIATSSVVTNDEVSTLVQTAFRFISFFFLKETKSARISRDKQVRTNDRSTIRNWADPKFRTQPKYITKKLVFFFFLRQSVICFGCAADCSERTTNSVNIVVCSSQWDSAWNGNALFDRRRRKRRGPARCRRIISEEVKFFRS